MVNPDWFQYGVEDSLRHLMDVLREDTGSAKDADWPQEAKVSMYGYLEKGVLFLKIFTPGVRKEDISVTLDAGVVSISFTRKELPCGDEPNVFIQGDIPCGTFKTSLQLGDNYQQASISADYLDGVLTLAIANKKKKTAPVVIPIK